ncbi:MAG: hypothetical protein HYS09_00730 [Chloroflexi bacterium]|nr:hypothetical protein [Chloroflexota bacterium]
MRAQRARPGWPLLVVLLAGILVITGLWFVITRPLDSGKEEKGGRYVEAVIGVPARINPAFASLNQVDRDVSSLVFSGLTRLGLSGEILPDLAESWETSKNGRVYTFHLRSGVSWHTGSPFTADDVIFTYSLLADPDFPGDPALSQLWQQVECVAPNKLTVECRLPQPFAPFLSFTTIGILPQHVLKGTTAEELASSTFNLSPVGTGPFRLVEIDETRAVLRRFDSYYGALPQLLDIELFFYPDHQAAMTALFRGEVNGLILGPNVSQEDLDSLAAVDNLRLYSANSTAYTALYLNNEAPALVNKNVRQAIAYTVRRDDLISGLLSGRAVRADSPIAPGTWASSPDIEPYQPDLEKAHSLLEKAGWKLNDDNVRVRKGVELRISLLTDADVLRRALAEDVGRQLRHVGIQVTVVSLGATELVRNYLLPHRYQAAIFGFDPGYDPDPYPAWHSSQISEGGRNLSGYVSEEADKLLENARKTIDISRRQALYYEFQEVFNEDLPSLLLYYPVYNYFVDASIENVRLGPVFDPSIRFATVSAWTVKVPEKVLE